MDSSQICTSAKKKGDLSPSCGRPSGALQSYPALLRKRIYDFRDANEGWGAVSILVELEEKFGYPKSDLPTPYSVHRYLRECGFIKSKEPKGNLPNGTLPLVKQVHDLWEMDAQGAVAVDGLAYIAMINIKDAKSKTYIGAFPVQVKGAKSQPKTVHYLWALRLAFEEFGLPKAIQVDKDSVFIDNTSKSAFPSKLRLFLLALGVELCFIELPPPAKQAMVERAHQTLYKQVLEGKTYANWQALFSNTNERRRILNYKYPCRTLGKKAPLQAFPQVAKPQRSYCLEQEPELLKIERVEAFLATCKWFRKVSTVKTLSLGKIHYLKQAKPNTALSITFCNKNKKLIFRDVNELIVQEIDASDFVKKLLNFPPIEEMIDTKRKLFENDKFPLE